MKFPKTMGGAVSLLFKIFGITAMAAPAIGMVQNAIAKQDFSTLGNDLVYAYTGYQINGGAFVPAQTVAAAASVGGGIVLIQIGKFLGKAVR